jgi:hypothetical protein
MSDPRRRLRVDPQLVFGVSLIVSLAISWRGFEGAMHGSADIVTVGVRFLIAVAAVWTGLFMVASLIASYASSPTVVAPTTGASGSPGSPRSSALPSGNRALDADNVAAAAIAAETETAAG